VGRLFARKSIESIRKESEGSHALQRHLGPFHLVAIGIGAIIGAGIFIITGQAAALYAGPAIILSFLVAFAICAFTGLCYAELSAMLPSAGASYSYAYVALGEYPAWIMGWLIAVQYLIVGATVGVGWSGYFSSMMEGLGVHLNPVWMQAPWDYVPGQGWEITGAYFNLPAVLVILIIGAFISVGIKAATRLNNLMVFVKLATLVLFILLGIKFIKVENWTPFIPQNTGIFGEYGWSGILRGAGVVFFAYLGFDTVATLTQEAKDPQRSVPKGILLSLAICTAGYALLSLVLTGMVAYPLLNVADPMAVAMRVMGPNYAWMRLMIEIAILAGLASVILVVIMGISRILLTISRDGLLPAKVGHVHPRFQTPFFTSLLLSGIAALMAAIFPLSILGEIVSMIALFIFGTVCLNVLVLRARHPSAPRPFKVPLVPYVPIAGALTCFAQMCFLPLTAWLQFFFWICLGTVFYYFYGMKNSKLNA